MRYYSSTAQETTLTAPVSGSATTITVASTAGFPALTPYTLSIDADNAAKELVEVTGVSGNNLTVVRGVDGTSGVSHLLGAKVSHDHSARDFREPQEHIAADTGVHGVQGQVVGTNNAQVLANKTLVSPAFSGTPTGLTKAHVGLGNVDNTSDADKPVSTAVAAAIANAIQAAKLAMYPVGAIYMSTTNTNPGSFLGGTWVAWGSGRVPVGVDTNQTEFDTVEKTGGAKTHTLTISQMPSHTHTQQAHNHGPGSRDVFGVYSTPVSGEAVGAIPGTGQIMLQSANGVGGAATTASTVAVNNNTGGGQPHNNLQPYITCYMWKRTA